MFTYLNSEGTQMFFGVELANVKLSKPKEKKTTLDLRLVTLVVRQPGKDTHELQLGLYAMSKDLLDGLATIDYWAKDKNYITLSALRKRLSESYGSPMIEADINPIQD